MSDFWVGRCQGKLDIVLWQIVNSVTIISLINVEVRINVEGVQKLPNH